MQKIFKTTLLLIFVFQLFSLQNAVAQNLIKKDTPDDKDALILTPTPDKPAQDTAKTEEDSRFFLEVTLCA